MEPDTLGQPFLFFTESPLVVLTGRKASNLPELLRHLNEVSGSSIFYHTHYLYLAHHFEKPTFHNDFAHWTSQALQEERLAEGLAAIDLLAMTSIRQLRERLIAVIRGYLEGGGDRWRECPPGDEFHFCEAKSIIMPTGLVAHDVPQLFAQVGQVSTACLHFHFFEARLRLEKPTNDFSHWLAAWGEDRLARRIDRLNPYQMTLDELKVEIVKLGRRHQRK
ncbi:MAG: DUF5752 family protein [Acidobacteriia bacterium]|nr:DUF5752 family protein [Terriglobia bacterium]